MTKLYPHLAFNSLKKNKRIYLPYLLACIGTVMMFYIMLTLWRDKALDTMSGGSNVKMVLSFGSIVIALFSVIILAYTNSVMSRHRKKEFGLYNILGMEKRHIGRIVFFETLYTAVVSLFCGLVGGVVFSKLMQLMLMRILKTDITFELNIDYYAMGITCALFCAIFFLLYINTRRIIRKAKPVDLLVGANVGEKEPKSKWILAILGVLCLCGGYFISLRTDSAIYAIFMFFIAVILVIIGTYLLFTAVSIVFLKMLKKNKRYFYKTRHFATVSGMLYRMKRNAAGLASICILSTMVLVTVSTTVCLYSGGVDIVNSRYPYDISIDYYSTPDENDIHDIDKNAMDIVSDCSLKATNHSVFHSLCFAMTRDKNTVIAGDAYSTGMFSNVIMVCATDAKSYESLTGKQIILSDSELLLYTDAKEGFDSFSMFDKDYSIENLNSFPYESGFKSMGYETVYIVVKDFSALRTIETTIEKAYKEDTSTITSSIRFNLSGTDEEKVACADKLSEATNTLQGNQFEDHVSCKQKVMDDDFLSIFGVFFFLGLFLGVLFMLTTVLIIYYKQLSEGYDDCDKYDIMQKVGMTKKEVKQTIRSQVLTVFFMPLVTAAVHVAFAFPMIKYIMSAFSMYNTTLFLICTLITFLVFAIIYSLVYLFTARTYYNIVSSHR